MFVNLPQENHSGGHSSQYKLKAQRNLYIYAPGKYPTDYGTIWLGNKEKEIINPLTVGVAEMHFTAKFTAKCPDDMVQFCDPMARPGTVKKQLGVSFR